MSSQVVRRARKPGEARGRGVLLHPEHDVVSSPSGMNWSLLQLLFEQPLFCGSNLKSLSPQVSIRHQIKEDLWLCKIKGPFRQATSTKQWQQLRNFHSLLLPERVILRHATPLVFIQGAKGFLLFTIKLETYFWGETVSIWHNPIYE